MVDLATFRQSHLVCGLRDEQVLKVAELATVRLVHGGELLAQLGRPATDVFVVLSGRLNVLTHDGDKLAEIAPGGVVGEVELVDNRPSEADVVAAGSGTLASIPIVGLRRLMGSDRELGFVVLVNISQLLAGRLRQADAHLDELMDEVHDGMWTHCQ